MSDQDNSVDDHQDSLDAAAGSMEDDVPTVGPGGTAWRAAAWLSAFIHRRAGAVLLVAAGLTVLACMLAANLRIDQGLRRLLPETFPSVVRLDRLSQELGQQSDLYVTIRSPSRADNIAFGTAIAERLRGHDSIRYVQFQRDTSFFEARALLYADLGDLVDLRRRVIARIRDEVARRAYGEFDDGDDTTPRDADDDAGTLGFDTEAMRERYGLGGDASEYMEADEGRIMVVKIRPTETSTDLAFAGRITSAVLAVAAELEPTRFHPEMRVTLDGSYVQHTDRVRTLQDDVLGGSVATALALLGSLAIYFRSSRAIAFIFVPLLASVVGALAYAWVFFGVLNLVSAFIFAVLLGLGIDFGIHILARLREERARGASSQDALTITLATSGWTSVAGGISTALAFAALMVADFQGFAQFGEIAAFGILLALVAALVVMPALVIVLDRVWPWRPSSVESLPTPGRPLPRAVQILGLVLCVLGLAVAAWTVPRLGALEFEHDLRKLGSSNEGAKPRELGYRDAVGRGQTVDPVIAIADVPEAAESVQRQLEALRAMTTEEAAAFDPAAPPTRPLPASPVSAREADEQAHARELEDDGFEDDTAEFGDDDLDDPRFVALEDQAVREAVMSPETAALLGRYGRNRLQVMHDRLGGVWSIHAFVPRLQAEKLAVIHDIRARIDARRGSLSRRSQEQIDEWYRYLEVDRVIAAADLPPWVRAQFEDRHGQLGRSVVVATHGPKADIDNAGRIYAAFGTLFAQVDGRSAEVPTAAEFYVLPEIFAAIEKDGPVVVVLAAGVMMLTTFLLLRRLSSAALIAVTVGFAFLWLGAVMIGLGWKLNFFNIIAIPLLLGMGEDNALHLSERYREDGGDLRLVLLESGGAIFMTTLTTVWGFAGILFADHRGLISLAWLSVTGMTLMLLASVVILPVLLELGRRRKVLAPGSRPEGSTGSGPGGQS